MKEKTQAEVAKIRKYSVLVSLALMALLVAGIVIYLPRKGSNDKQAADKKADKKATLSKGARLKHLT
jgi:flagellar basal body-associated protein FliL